MKIELISFKICPYVQRSVIVLLEKHIDYDITYIDLKNPPDWFKEISPLGKVPILRCDGEVLFESAVINEYLDETHPPSLHPADPLLKARNRAWIELNSEINGGLFRILHAKSAGDFTTHHDTVRQLLGQVEKQLAARKAKGDWFNGETFSLVDAAFGPSLMRIDYLQRWFRLELNKDLPHVQAWAQALLARDSMQRSVVEDFAQLYRAHAEKAGGHLLTLQKSS